MTTSDASIPATPVPRPHHRVVESTLGDDVVLFHLDTRRLHVLNGSAAAIWTVLHEAATVGDATIQLGNHFAVDPTAIRDDVERTIAEFRDDGLLADEPLSASPIVSMPAEPEDGTDADNTIPETGVYRALDAQIVIECHDAELIDAIAPVLAPLIADGASTVSIRIREIDDGRWGIRVGSGPEIVLGSRLAVALRVIGEINTLAVASVPDELVFHAGAVTDGERTVLMPAASNHGKSTLTTALVRAGFDYLTDEAAALTDEFTVRPFAKSIALDPGSFPIFPDLAPPPATGLATAVACREWHIDPARIGASATPRPVAAVVCPHWRAGSATRHGQLAPLEALHLLLGETFDFACGGQPLFERLVRLVETVPVYRLGYSDLDEACETVTRLLSGDREPHTSDAP